MDKIDQYGRVIFEANDIFELLYCGHTLSGDFLVRDAEQYNQLCRKYDKTDYMLTIPQEMTVNTSEYHENRQKTWLYPQSYREMDLWGLLESRCQNDIQLTRLQEERSIYEKKDLTDLLRLMLYLVDNFRARNIVWGVGRGSSVASFVLYLIGITKIDPLKFGLDIGEFLKD